MRYKLLLLLIPFLIFSSCVSDKTLTDVTYFGGKIINPKSNKVFFYQAGNLLDSTELNHKNKFIFKFDSLKVGYYSFKHDRELQYVFLEPNDSLLLRLNTWDFDESLVFSGKGAEKNNLLLNLFLENEKEDKLFYNFYALNDSLFVIKIDSVLNQKKLLYKHFKENAAEISPLYDKYVNAAIYLPLYKKKEVYPFRHKMALKLKEFPHMNPEFYKYRKDINLNDKDISNFYAHYAYVRDYLYHLSYEKNIINKSDVSTNFIEAITKYITVDGLKNMLLEEGIWDVILNDEISLSDKEKAKKLFIENCTDKKLLSSMTDLIKASEAPKNGSIFPTVTALNISGKKVTINEITKNKNVVIYFWPSKHRQIENLAKRVNYLEKQNPEIQFIGLNTHHIDYNWKSYIKSNNFNSVNQFLLKKNSNEVDWLFKNYSRAVIVDKNGIVLNGFTYLTNPKFMYQLKKIKKN